MFENMTFECYKCKKTSRLNVSADTGSDIRRLHGDGKIKEKITFMCEHCGVANSIEINLENASSFLESMSSTDPDIQKAIDAAKKGDISSAIDMARKKFGL